MAESKMATILFADVAGSTGLYERLGDQQARQIMSSCLELIAATVKGGHGRVIKTIGDEVMSVFESAAKGIAAAVAIQENIVADRYLAGQGIKVRIGLHHGPVIFEAGDVFGDAVNLAARVASQAKADQILTTGKTLALVDPADLKGTRLVDQARVKGKKNPVKLHEVFWGRIEEMTMVGGADRYLTLDASKLNASRLTLEFDGLTWIVDTARPSLSIGRGDTNDLVVDDRLVSRLHASIEMQRRRFFIIDHSTNGTYVQSGQSPAVFLHREQAALTGSGSIACGQRPTSGSSFTIAYRVANDHPD